MNTHINYIALRSGNWPALALDVRTAITDFWHDHAGRWQPSAITLEVSLELLPEAVHRTQRVGQLPGLVAWLRQQGQTIRIIGVEKLPEHRLFLKKPPTNQVATRMGGGHS